MLSDFQKIKLTYLFQLFDFKKNGAIRNDDFMELAEKIAEEVHGGEGKPVDHTKLPLAFFKRLVADMDSIRRYEVTLEKWLNFFDKEVVNNPDSETLEEYAQLILDYIFGYFDQNKDGYISLEEYKRLFGLLGKFDKKSEANFSRLDVTNNSKLSRYELMIAIETFLTTDDIENPDNWVFGDYRSK